MQTPINHFGPSQQEAHDCINAFRKSLGTSVCTKAKLLRILERDYENRSEGKANGGFGIAEATATSRLSEIRGLLETYFGDRPGWRFMVSHHPHVRIIFTHQPGESITDELSPTSCLRAFWSPFASELDVIYPQNHLVDQENDRAELLGNRMESDAIDDPETAGDHHRGNAKNYVMAGHLELILGIQRCLLRLQFEGFAIKCADETRYLHIARNVIHLGTSRSNTDVRLYVGADSPHSTADLPYRIGPDSILRGSRQFHEYTDVEGQPRLTRVFALVTRMPSTTSGEALIVAANHSAACSALANYLTSENQLNNLCVQLRTNSLASSPTGFPARFQALFAVDVNRHDERIPGIQCMPQLLEVHVPQQVRRAAH